MADEKKTGEKTIEMRLAEIEDKLAKLHITEEEMQAYQKVSGLLGSQMGAQSAEEAPGTQAQLTPSPIGNCIVAQCIISQCIQPRGVNRFINRGITPRINRGLCECNECSCGPCSQCFSGGGGFSGGGNFGGFGF